MSRRTLDVLRAVLAVLVLVAVGFALAGSWDEVAEYAGRLEPGTIVAATAVGAVAPWLTMLGWRVLLADLGSPLARAPASGVFFVGQLGKYLPGSVWSVVAQTEMAKGLGVPRQRTAVVGLLTIGLAALSGGVVGLPAVPSLVSRSDSAATGWSVLLALPLLVVLAWPRVLNALLDRALRVLRRPPLDHRLGTRAVLLTSALFCGAWITSGLSVFVFADATASASADGGQLLLVSVAGYALASAVAMLAVVLPAGVGLREGLLILLLSPFMPVAAATAVVVLTRFLTIVLDLLFALGGWLYGRSHHLLVPESS